MEKSNTAVKHTARGGSSGGGAFGIIYKGTTPDGRVYVGQTRRALYWRVNAFHSHKHRGRPIDDAVKKHGVKNFRWEVLRECGSQAELDAAEADFIKSEGAHISAGGLNMEWGRRVPRSAEVCAKISATKKGVSFSAAHKAAIGVAARARARTKAGIDALNRNRRRWQIVAFQRREGALC